jgi:hypothetical protein
LAGFGRLGIVAALVVIRTGSPAADHPERVMLDHAGAANARG